jgi:hypothetical protein
MANTPLNHAQEYIAWVNVALTATGLMPGTIFNQHTTTNKLIGPWAALLHVRRQLRSGPQAAIHDEVIAP